VTDGRAAGQRAAPRSGTAPPGLPWAGEIFGDPRQGRRRPRIAAYRDATAPGNLAPRFTNCQPRSILFRVVTVCSLHCSPLSALIGACITCRYLEEQIGVSVMA
jgi:hypothetical protein